MVVNNLIRLKNCRARRPKPSLPTMDSSEKVNESLSESFLPVPICDLPEVDISSEVESDLSNTGSKVTVSSVFSQICEQHNDPPVPPRTRKSKRPFSPESSGHAPRVSGRAKAKKKRPPLHGENPPTDKLQGNLFTCDQCGSRNIVDPSRCRIPINQLKKIQTVRRKVDPTTNKILNLCNACGLAYSRPLKKDKKLQATGVVEDRVTYLAEAESFAKSIAVQFRKPAAERLYCPAFKNKPCGCIQTYLSQEDDPEGCTLEYKVDNLLKIFSTACSLNRRKKLFPEYKALDQKSTEDISPNPTERKQRQKEYEHFILDTRQMLREKLQLCERACQRILLYSNNFLHKRLKSAPNQGSRVSKQLGRNSMGQLKPIEELGSLSCCADSCSRLALTHAALLEEWRNQASLGQRQARRVLAEMLTPSGGTKANCYKFISMVTGCGPTTISSVSHQMRITKGIREPPEHGLKKWHRENPRKPSKSLVGQIDPSSASCGLQEPGQLQDPKLQIERQQQELEEAKRQLYLKQQELDNCRQIIDQHFLQSSASGGSSLPKVNVIRSTYESAEIGTHSINLPMESNITSMSELSNGQSVQIIDLVPGTYIAVPSSFDNSTILTVAPDSKQAGTHNMQSQQEIYSDNLQLIPASCESSGLLIHSENGVQTIFNISAAAEEVVGSVLDVDESQLQSTGNCDQEVYVMSSVCNGDKFLSSGKSHSTVISECGSHSLTSEHNSMSLVASHNSLTHSPELCRTTVITPSYVESEKSLCNGEISTFLASESSTVFKDLKSVDCVNGLHESSSLPSVVLLSTSQQTQLSDHEMSEFGSLLD